MASLIAHNHHRLLSHFIQNVLNYIKKVERFSYCHTFEVKVHIMQMKHIWILIMDITFKIF